MHSCWKRWVLTTKSKEKVCDKSNIGDIRATVLAVCGSRADHNVRSSAGNDGEWKDALYVPEQHLSVHLRHQRKMSIYQNLSNRRCRVSAQQCDENATPAVHFYQSQVPVEAINRPSSIRQRHARFPLTFR